MHIDSKRIIQGQGWAMLLAVGDELEGEPVTDEVIAQVFDLIGRIVGALQDVRGGDREYNVSLGNVIGKEIRANGSELWVLFEPTVMAYSQRRAAINRSTDGKPRSLDICTPEVRSLPGDREQRQ
jgi:hypothetical protein